MKVSLSILFASLSILSFSYCSKMPENGLLDGKWQLSEMYSKTTHSDAHYVATLATDKRADNIYWNIQLKLLYITSAKPLNTFTNETVARFHYSGSTLQVGPTYIHYRDRDSLITNANSTELIPLGIRGNATTYNIKRLNASTLILCSSLDSLIFKKLR